MNRVRLPRYDLDMSYNRGLVGYTDLRRYAIVLPTERPTNEESATTRQTPPRRRGQGQKR